MADIIRKVAYFAMDIPNKPGEGARVLGALAEGRREPVGILWVSKREESSFVFYSRGCSGVQKGCQGSKDQDPPQKFGFLAQGNDRQGAVAGLLKTLAAKNINVTAIDAVSAGAGRYAAILWVNPRDVNKTAKALGAR